MIILKKSLERETKKCSKYSWEKQMTDPMHIMILEKYAPKN